MRTLIKKLFVFLVSFYWVTCGWPLASTGHEFSLKGEKTADEAARYGYSEHSYPGASNLKGFSILQPDTTETLIFEDEDRNLAKEITVWVIGAAFVGYFIVKVFLQGDTDETPEEKPGKEIPGGGVSAGVWSHRF